MITLAALQATYQAKGWPIFTAPFDLNFFGVQRGTDPEAWDDVLGVWYASASGRIVLETWDGTTAPGLPGMLQPGRSAGVAILAPGFHRGAWKPGRHKGVYPCLVQARELPVYRDATRDSVIDRAGELDVGWHALQVHHGGGARRVGRYSLGCQATRWPADLERLLALLELQQSHGRGSTLSYGLLLDRELVALAA